MKKAFSLIKIFFLTAIIIFLASLFTEDPFKSFSSFFLGPFKNMRTFSEVFTIFSPLLLMSTVTYLIFLLGKDNLGLTSSFICGGLVAGWIATSKLTSPLSLILIMLLAFVFGSLPIMTIEALTSFSKTNLLVNSLLMNYLVLYTSRFILSSFLRDTGAGTIVSAKIPNELKLGKLLFFDWGFLLAIISFVFLIYILSESKLGLKLKLIGKSPKYASLKALDLKKIGLTSQLLAGGLAGLSAALYLLSNFSRYDWVSQPTYGWDAIMVAILAGENAFSLLPLSFFVSFLRIGVNSMARNSGLSPDLVSLVQGLVILLVIRRKRTDA